MLALPAPKLGMGLSSANTHPCKSSSKDGLRRALAWRPLKGHCWRSEDLDEEDRRPTQRRRIEQAQGHGFDDDEPMVRRSCAGCGSDPQ